MKFTHTEEPLNLAERSFRSMVNEGFFNRFKDTFLHDLDNFYSQTGVGNLFSINQVNPDKKVIVKYSAIRNPLTKEEYKERNRQNIYHPYIPAVSIKLMSSIHMFKGAGVTDGELLIALDSDRSMGYFEVHAFREDLPKTVMVVKARDVITAIDALMG